MATPVAFKAYQRTQHAWDGFAAYHGTYDGLATGPCEHPHAQLLIPLGGRIQLELGGETLLLGPERAIALPAHTPHAASTLGGSFEFLALNAPARWLAEVHASLDLPMPAGATLVSDAGVWLQARQLAAVLDRPGPGQERFLRAGAEQLGLYVARGATPRMRAGEVERAVAAMLARYMESLTVAGLAAELALSPRQLERRFQAELGVSPRRFLVDVRLAAARERLVAGDEAIEAVGLAVGFGDPSHFARSFKAAAGMSPGAYRKARKALLDRQREE